LIPFNKVSKLAKAFFSYYNKPKARENLISMPPFSYVDFYKTPARLGPLFIIANSTGIV
jgi:hypothetical protein